MPFNTRYTPSHQASTHEGVAGSRGLARLHAVAVAAALCAFTVHHGDAQALALGRIVVQSALGEPLRAEIDVPDINNEEAASLRVGLASGEAFRAAGMDFNPALTSLQISLQRRANGTAFLRLTSARPVNEPFVDLIVEANWSSGRIVRDYTLLLDPPSLRAGTAVAPLPAGVAPPPVLPPVVRPTAPPAPPQVLVPPARPAPAPKSEISGTQQVRVQAGDTAGRIAAANRPSGVSLDQMLVAMLRANPSAFTGGNVNRLKSGSVLNLPGANDAGNVAPREASQIIAAQSRDFNEFRRRLAGTVPAASVAAADRQTSGRVEAEVQDKQPVAPTQDRLTLSKGVTPGQTAVEEKIAQERQAKEASSRVAELSRNIDELAKLGTSTSVVAPPSAGSVPPGTVSSDPALNQSTVPAAPTAPALATAPSTAQAGSTATLPLGTAATAAATGTAAITPAAPPVTLPAPSPVRAPVPLPAAPSFIDELRDNPMVMPAAGALLALLAGFGLYRYRQRKKANGIDSSFLESRLQPDSFFGSSGGQRIDTADSSVSGSSMVYSPSQLDAAGDVDPVAEADVYLAYGRDLQAEEILKEAMRSTPTRVAIHTKLLEIYAKRRDVKAFEVVAAEAYALTQGEGAEWKQACALGRELDPSNTLYQPGGGLPLKAGAVAAAAAVGDAVNTMPFGNSSLTQNAGPDTGVRDRVLDLDLDFSLDEPLAPVNLEPLAPMTDAALSGMDDLRSTDALTRAVEDKSGQRSMSMDFDMDFPSEGVPLNDEISRSPSSPDTLAPLDGGMSSDFELDPPQSFDLASLDEGVQQTLPPSMGTDSAAEADLLSFDLPSIDPGPQDGLGGAPERAHQLTEEDPLDTKLSLAEEFRAIGDLEGARSLAEEVLTEASGALRTKASRFLADLN